MLGIREVVDSNWFRTPAVVIRFIWLSFPFLNKMPVAYSMLHCITLSAINSLFLIQTLFLQTVSVCRNFI